MPFGSILLMLAKGRADATGKRLGRSGWTAVAGLCGLCLLGVWSLAAPRKPADARSMTLPASAIATTVRWNDFGAGIELAQSEGKPVLATFVTDWCPYCTKMKKTWRSSAVAARLEALVAVRVDAEETRTINGHRGRDLAARYRVQGYPVQLLLDADGTVLGRYDGYQTAGQLLDWLDAELGRPSAPDALSRTGG